MPTVWNLVVSDPGELDCRGKAAEHKHQYWDEDELKKAHQRAQNSGMNVRIEEAFNHKVSHTCTDPDSCAVNETSKLAHGLCRGCLHDLHDAGFCQSCACAEDEVSGMDPVHQDIHDEDRIEAIEESRRRTAQDGGGGDGGGGGDAGGGGGDAGASADCGSTSDACASGCGGSHSNAGGCTSCACRGFFGGYPRPPHHKKKKHHRATIEAPAGVTEGILEGDDGSLFYTSDAGVTWDKIGGNTHDAEEEEEDDDIKLFKFDHGPGEGNETAHSEIHQQEHTGGLDDYLEEKYKGWTEKRQQERADKGDPRQGLSPLRPVTKPKYNYADPAETDRIEREKQPDRYVMDLGSSVRCPQCDFDWNGINCAGCGYEVPPPDENMKIGADMSGMGCGRCGQDGHTSEHCPSNKGSNALSQPSNSRYLNMNDFQPKEAHEDEQVESVTCPDCETRFPPGLLLQGEPSQCPNCNTPLFPEDWKINHQSLGRTADHVYDDDDPTCAEGDGKKAIGSFLDNKVCDDHLRYYLADAPSQLSKAEDGIRSASSIDRLKYENLAQKIKHDMKAGSERLAELDRDKESQDDGLRIGAVKVAADGDYNMDLNQAHHPWWFDEEGNPGYFDELPDHKCPYCGVDQSGRDIQQHVNDHDRLKIDVKGKPIAPEDYDRWMNEDPSEWDKKPFTGKTQEKIMYTCERCGGQATHEAVAKTGARGLLCSDHAVTMKAASAVAGAGLLVFPLTKEAFDLATCPSCGDYSENHVEPGCLGTLTSYCATKCGGLDDYLEEKYQGWKDNRPEKTPKYNFEDKEMTQQIEREKQRSIEGAVCPTCDKDLSSTERKYKYCLSCGTDFTGQNRFNAGMATPNGMTDQAGGGNANCNCKGVGCSQCMGQSPAAQAAPNGVAPMMSHVHDDGKPFDILLHMQEEHGEDPSSVWEAEARHNELRHDDDRDPGYDEDDPANDPNQEWDAVRDHRLSQHVDLDNQHLGKCVRCGKDAMTGDAVSFGADWSCSNCAPLVAENGPDHYKKTVASLGGLSDEVIAYLYDTDPEGFMEVTGQNIGCPNCDHGTMPDGSVCRACFGTGHGGGIMLHSNVGEMTPHCGDCGSQLQADEHANSTSPMYYCGGGCGEYKQGDEIDWADEDGNLVSSDGVTPHEGAAKKKPPAKKKKTDKDVNDEAAGTVKEVLDKANGLMHKKTIAEINPAAGPDGTATSDLVDNVPNGEPYPTGERHFIRDHKGEVAHAEPDKCKFCGEPMQDHAQWNPTHEDGATS